MTAPGLDQGRIVRTETLTHGPAEALAGLLDIELEDTGGLPPLWHWVYLLDHHLQRELGPDGHATSGVPAPPGPGRRRMFAGGRVTTHRPLRIGADATRTTSVTRTVEKEGRSGPLTFVTVQHVYAQDGIAAVEEEQDIVYRPPASSLPPPPAPVDLQCMGPVLSLDVDEILLFRFSALTYNAHRIHYDRAYARREDYDDLVVHGPLQALLLAELFRRNGVDLVGRQFAYRLVSPLTGPQRLTAYSSSEGLDAGAAVAGARGTVSAHAEILDAA